jgi:hypothetical protein
VYTVGETVNICSEIDNSKCSLNMNNVTYELKSYITMSAGSKTWTAEVIQEKATFPGIPAGQDAIGEKMRVSTLTLEKKDQPGYWEQKNLPSVNGMLIENKNFIHVIFDKFRS